jgi:hypothetical protein
MRNLSTRTTTAAAGALAIGENYAYEILDGPVLTILPPAPVEVG